MKWPTPMCSKLEDSLRNAYKKNYKVELLMKGLEVRSDLGLCCESCLVSLQSRLSDDLSNFKAIDSLLRDVYSTLQVSPFTTKKYSAVPRDSIPRFPIAQSQTRRKISKAAGSSDQIRVGRFYGHFNGACRDPPHYTDSNFRYSSCL